MIAPGQLLRRPRRVGAALACVSIAMLAAAFYFQHVEGLSPCPLCIWQRWAHGAAAAAGLLCLAAATPARAPWLLALAALVLVGGGGIAAYHVGVELGWFASAFCGIGEAPATAAELKAMLLETDPARCDEVPWSLAGISMAGYNLIVSAAAAAVAAAAARAAWRHGRARADMEA